MSALLAVSPARPLREALREIDRSLNERFVLGERVAPLLAERARGMDELLARAWRMSFGADAAGLALLAVGGYGRGELFPASDVDVVVLRPAAADAATDARIGGFIALLWDVGVAPSHSVRTLAGCVDAARAEQSIATALYEARHVAGDAAASADLLRAIADPALWPATEFLVTKRAELATRHAR